MGILSPQGSFGSNSVSIPPPPPIQHSNTWMGTAGSAIGGILGSTFGAPFGGMFWGPPAGQAAGGLFGDLIAGNRAGLNDDIAKQQQMANLPFQLTGGSPMGGGMPGMGGMSGMAGLPGMGGGSPFGMLGGGQPSQPGMMAGRPMALGMLGGQY